MLISTRTVAVCLAAAWASAATAKEIQAEFTVQQWEAAMSCFMVKTSLNVHYETEKKKKIVYSLIFSWKQIENLAKLCGYVPNSQIVTSHRGLKS